MENDAEGHMDLAKVSPAGPTRPLALLGKGPGPPPAGVRAARAAARGAGESLAGGES